MAKTSFSLEPGGSGESGVEHRIIPPDGALRCVRGVSRSPTGTTSLDEITGGGLHARHA